MCLQNYTLKRNGGEEMEQCKDLKRGCMWFEATCRRHGGRKCALWDNGAETKQPDGACQLAAVCNICGSPRLQQTGTCRTCLDCGETTGCG